MKTINFVLLLLLGLGTTSCVYNEKDELLEEANPKLFIQDVKFRMNEDLGELGVNFYLGAINGSTGNSFIATIAVLDGQLREVETYSIPLNKEKKEIVSGVLLQEEIYIPVPVNILTNGGALYLDIKVDETPFPRVRYVYTKISIPDWGDGPILGV